MRQIARSNFCLIAVCLTLGYLAAQMFPVARTTAQRPTDSQRPTTEQSPKPINPSSFPPAARLGANMYLQTSGEFRACCLTIYRCAGERLATIVAELPKGERPLAVVLDLDETVFDNSAFQTFLYRNKIDYLDKLWWVYEQHHPQDVTLIPGAKEFLERARTWESRRCCCRIG